MGIPGSANLLFLGGGAEEEYEIAQSLRFDGGSYLYRTPSSASNRRTWTYSVWVKLAKLGSAQTFLTAYSADNNNSNLGCKYANTTYGTYSLSINLHSQAPKATTAQYKDYTSWMHLVFVFDTPNANQSYRQRIFVNGIEAGDEGYTSLQTQNLDGAINNNIAHRIGQLTTSGHSFEGYLAEAHFVDGQALEPTYFGKFSETTGEWVPIEYTGTYGTNGWYLTFDPSASNGFGHDHSGNGNHWSVSGFSTSSSTYYKDNDNVLDTPTNNCAVWLHGKTGGNGLPGQSQAYADYRANANLYANSGRNSPNAVFASMVFPPNAKSYIEVHYMDVVNGSPAFALGADGNGFGPFIYGSGNYNQDTVISWSGYTGNLDTSISGSWSGTSNAGTFGQGDLVGCAVDTTGSSASVTLYKNGTQVATGTVAAAYSNSIVARCEGSTGSSTAVGVNLNAGQHPFSNLPSGYSGLTTTNFPDPDVPDGRAHFKTNLAAGNQILDTRSAITVAPDALSNTYYLGANIDDPGYFNKGGPNASLGNRSLYGTNSSGFYNNGNVGSSNTPTYNNGYIEFATALSLSGNCYVYWGNTSAGNGSELGAAIRVTYGDGTTATSQLGKTIDYPEGSWTVGNFSFNKRYIGRYTLNNSKTLKKVEISSSMSGRYAAHIAAIVINDSAEIDLGTLTISVEDGSKFSVGDDVYKSSDSFISGTVTGVSGNNVTIRTSEGFIEDTNRRISWADDWTNADLVHRDAATAITDLDWGLTWVKDRANSNNHQWLDSVRGTNKVLESDTDDNERTYSAPSGDSVAWQWKANGSGSSNTVGSINSTASVNTTAGISIVGYTAAGSAGTVGHGLGVAPAAVIMRSRTFDGYSWYVYHQHLASSSYFLRLNNTNAQTFSNDPFGGTAPTSTVFSVGGENVINTHNYIAYCFAEVEGFSKFGKYTGNGSSDGIFLYTGFRPAWFMLKAISDTGEWLIIDSTRDKSNTTNAVLEAHDPTNEAGAEDADMDFLSNGIKFKNTGYYNTSGRTFVYFAFAESPYKYATAR